MNYATYSPEDNKIRLYVGRVPRDEYEALRAEGWTSTPKQDCDFVAVWSPAREDRALSYLDEGQDIEDEDYSPEERSADRAERFTEYRDKRRSEAHKSADTFDAGPSAFGHQNRARAERQAARHDRHRSYAVSQWSKAEYWQTRTAGVIRHALHKSSAPVRRSRVLRLEAEQRKHLKGLEDAQARYDAWRKVSTMDGADEVLGEDSKQWNQAQRLAYTLANHGGSWWTAYHPTSEEVNAKNREIHSSGYNRGFSAYDFLTKREYCGLPFERLTPRQVAELYLASVTDPSEEGHSWHRWTRHYELRLSYENAMLENEGGKAAEVDIEPGGWVRISRDHWQIQGSVGAWVQIQKVNKSSTTGRVCSVGVLCSDGIATINIERQGEDAYRAPTEEERKSFAAAKKANKKPPVSLINPTDEDAEKLQEYLNECAAQNARDRQRQPSTPREVKRITQAEYSRYSGPDSLYHVAQFEVGGAKFKVRTKQRGYGDYYAADSVLILTDKPQKPLPVDWQAVAAPVEAEQAQPVATATKQQALFA